MLYPLAFQQIIQQSRGAVNALREILKWSGFRIVATVEKGGTKNHAGLTERDRRACLKTARKITKR